MKATFKEKKHLATDIFTFIFETDEKVNYKPGQFTHIKLVHSDPDDRGEERWFTLSSSPSEDQIKITTRLVEGKRSSFKQAFSELKPGQKVQFGKIEGDFLLPDETDKEVVLVAGGIGVTPYRSQARDLIDKDQKRPYKVIYAARSEDNIVFEDELKQAGFDVKPLISEDIPDTDKLIEMLGDASKKIIYVSGPEQFVELVQNDLIKKSNIKKEQIKTDFFPGYEASLE